MGIREIVTGAGDQLTVYELEDVCDSVSGRALTGSWLWDSAIVLSQWMSAQAQVSYDFTNKIVLELGAGTGLPGLTAARLGASLVILTDIKQLIPVLEKNVEVNEVGDRVKVHELDWEMDELPSELSELGHVDLVLMSDVFFDAAEMVALAKTLKKICGPETVVWGASEVRPWTSNVLNELRKEGFGIVELSSQLGCGVGLPEEVSEFFSVFQLVPTHDNEHLEKKVTEIAVMVASEIWYARNKNEPEEVKESPVPVVLMVFSNLRKSYKNVRFCPETRLPNLHSSAL